MRSPSRRSFRLIYRFAPDVYLGRCELLPPDYHAARKPAALLSDDGASFPRKHGLLDAQEYQRRLVEQGNPEAVSVQYPLSDLKYRDMGRGQNVLLITVDGLNYSRYEKQMPALAEFAENNIVFTQHMSSGNSTDAGIFGLFYGISPSYMDGVLSARIPAALITGLNQQGYQLGLFASDGFNSSLYRRAAV